MYKNLRKRTINKAEGFTIIEVLIVLAIAGLIMLIVFLAVPALQRNSRNNGRRNDVGRMGSAVSEYAANNNGSLPANGLAFAGLVLNSGNMSQYDPNVDLMYATDAQAVIPQATAPRVRLVTAAKCGAAGVTVTSRQSALQYQLESSGNHTNVCQDV